LLLSEEFQVNPGKVEERDKNSKENSKPHFQSPGAFAKFKNFRGVLSG
jgi:hypothetical protein